MEVRGACSPRHPHLRPADITPQCRQESNIKNQLIVIGLVLAILGGVGLAIDSVSWNEEETLVDIGELEASATVPKSQEIPPVLAGGVLALGLVLTGIGAARED